MIGLSMDQRLNGPIATTLSSAPKSRPIVFGAVAALADFIAVFAVVFISSAAYHLHAYGKIGNPDNRTYLPLLIALIFVFTNLLQKRYRLVNYLYKEKQTVASFNVWTVTMVAFVFVSFLAKTIDTYSRAAVFISFCLGWAFVPLARLAMHKATSRAVKTGMIATQRILLIGRENDIRSFVTRHQPWNSGLMIKDIFILRPPHPNETPAEAEERFNTDISQAVDRVREDRPDSAFIILPWSERRLIDRCIDAFMITPVAIHLAPDQILDRFDNPRIVQMGSISSLELIPRPFSAVEVKLKRAFDLLGALAMLVILLPVFLAIAVWIKLDSTGPVFFLQRRYGFNREPFRIIKFRTMTTMDDGHVIQQAQKNDPRITPAGAYLRRWNLDELPQLINVVIGQMSLVGPRPHAVSHDHEFEDRIDLYARRHNVKPGITGWAQIHGLRGETETDAKMEKRVEYDLWYIDNWSVWLDILIMFKTVFSRRALQNAR